LGGCNEAGLHHDAAKLNDRIVKMDALVPIVERLDKRVSKVESVWPAVQQLDKRVTRVEATNHFTAPSAVERPKP